MTVPKRLVAILTVIAMAVTAPVLGAGAAAADPGPAVDPGPAATPWAGKGDAVLVLTSTPLANRNAAATAASQIYCGVAVFDFDPASMSGYAYVTCGDEFNFPVAVPQITITLTLAVDDGTALGPSRTASAAHVSDLDTSVNLPTCFPDSIGVIADVTVVFPANTASGRFFSPNLVHTPC